MADAPEPPRKFYQLKPKEFERVNAPVSIPAEVATETNPASDSTSAPNSPPPPAGRIDVRDLARTATEGTRLLSGNAPANRENDVHAVLHEKFEREKTAGLFHVEPSDDKAYRRRVCNYWTALVLVNTPLAVIAWSVNPTKGMGPASAVVFVCAIAGIAMFTASWTWHNWFLRTER